MGICNPKNVIDDEVGNLKNELLEALEKKSEDQEKKIQNLEKERAIAMKLKIVVEKKTSKIEDLESEISKKDEMIEKIKGKKEEELSEMKKEVEEKKKLQETMKNQEEEFEETKKRWEDEKQELLSKLEKKKKEEEEEKEKNKESPRGVVYPVFASSMTDTKILSKEEYLNQGNGFFNKKMFEEAIKQYDLALSLDQHYFESIHYIGQSFKCLGNFQKAIYYLKCASKTKPTSSEVWRDLAFCFFRTNDLETAEEYYTRSLEIEPKIIPTLHNRALVRYTMKKYDLAASDSRKIISIDKQNYDAYIRLAKSLFELKKPEDTIKEVDEALSLMISDSAIKDEEETHQKNRETLSIIRNNCLISIRNRGVVQLNDDNYEEAFEIFKSILVYSPNDEKSKQLIEKCLERLKE